LFGVGNVSGKTLALPLLILDFTVPSQSMVRIHYVYCLLCCRYHRRHISQMCK